MGKKPLDLKFLADEGFSFAITSFLREEGYDVRWIGDFAPGISDKAVYKIAREDNRVILTDDKDFGELSVRFKFNAVTYNLHLSPAFKFTQTHAPSPVLPIPMR